MIPIRTCVVCRKKNNKNKLIRIVANKDKEAFYDRFQKENSRAIYICKNVDCLKKLKVLLSKNKLKVKILINNNSLLDIIQKIENELGE